MPDDLTPTEAELLDELADRGAKIERLIDAGNWLCRELHDEAVYEQSREARRSWAETTDAT